MVGVPGFTAALSAPDAAVTTLSAGQLIVGGSVSRTVTVKEQLAPPNSEVETTEYVPTAKNEPDPGLLLTAPQLPAPDAAP
jgi:hypothetical protein